MTITIHKTRPDWAKPLGTMIFVPFKMNIKTEKDRSRSPNQVKKGDKQDEATDKHLSVISVEAHHE